MSLPRTEEDAATWAAMACAAAMIGHQVGAKAARDTLFLSSFGASSLPTMVMTSAAASIGFVLLAGRLIARWPPARVVPIAFAASAVLQIGEWELARRAPGPAAVVLYLHVATFGSVLISLFWSLVGERLDPRAAKQRIARIASAGTLGGVLGGVAAERVAASLDVRGTLLLLAALHLVCASCVVRLRPDGATALPSRPGGPVAANATALRLLRQNTYLRSIALLVILGSLGVAIMDFLFKAAAVEAFGTGPRLLRLFAAFYTGTGLLAFVGQLAVSRLALERLGLANTAAALPLAVAGGGVASLLAPGLWSASGLRGAEVVLRSCLFRPAYEVLYTPLPPQEKRATKTLVDVALDRLGDIAGGLATRLVLAAAPQNPAAILSSLVVGTGLVGFWIARSLHRGYVHALERSLLARAVEIEPSQILDSTTRAIVIETRAPPVGTATVAPPLPLPILGAADTLDTGLFMLAASETPAAAAGAPAATPKPPALDPAVARIVELRSGEAARVGRALRHAPLQHLEAAHAIPLLAWDDVQREAAESLRAVAPRIVGQLLDSLLDPDEEFAVRRRIPRVLAGVAEQRAADGLVLGLHDRRFEVRFECARALARIRNANPAVRVDGETVSGAVLREAAADREIWRSRQLLDGPEAGNGSPADDPVLERCDRSLEHVFTLLSLVLPAEPLRIAFRGLHTGDAGLRGTALEYLESILPGAVRDALRPFLQPERAPFAPVRSREEILEALMRSHSSIELKLAALRPRTDPVP